MASFRLKFEQGLRSRKINVTHDLAEESDAILVIAGTRFLPQLWRARQRGIRVVQRLDGVNWVQRVKWSGLKYTIRAEYGNFILAFIRNFLADRVVYQSQFIRQWWEDWHGATKAPATVIINGVDLQTYSPAGEHERPPDVKRTEEVNLLQNSGFDSSLYMVIDVSGGTSATQYSVSYYPAAGDVPGGILGDDYKTTKILLRYIAPGVFMMGSPREQLGYDESQPPREMSVTNGFFMGVFEVTQHQWELVMGNNPSYYEDASASNSRPVEQVSCYEIRENAKTNKDDPDSNWPANNFVNDNSFMGKLRLKTGIRSFDLPTEIQWEYASRAGTTTALNSGKNITNMYIDSNVAEVARYYSNGGRGYKRDGTTLIMTAPVGSYRPNAWGLYDMHGNVSEWCLDWRCLYPASAPKWKGAEQANYSVLRGGGWDNVAWHCLVTSRTVSKPFQRSYNSGFRLVRNKAAKTEFNR
jgi:formylglycine-generating enzyme required for sulfatase activity